MFLINTYSAMTVHTCNPSSHVAARGQLLGTGSFVPPWVMGMEFRLSGLTGSTFCPGKPSWWPSLHLLLAVLRMEPRILLGICRYSVHELQPSPACVSFYLTGPLLRDTWAVCKCFKPCCREQPCRYVRMDKQNYRTVSLT